MANGVRIFDIYWGEPQEFCCGIHLRRFDYWGWTVDAIRPLFGEFGPWLDA